MDQKVLFVASLMLASTAHAQTPDRALMNYALAGYRIAGTLSGAATQWPAAAPALRITGDRGLLGPVAALASVVAGPNAALAAAPQHHDQVPGFYRLKVGDLEVTALFDGTGVFDPHWLTGTKATMDGVVEAMHEDPHLLDVADTGFLVNTGKQLILVDAGAGTWWGGGAFGRLAGSLRSAGYTGRKKSTSFWSRTSIRITSAA